MIVSSVIIATLLIIILILVALLHQRHKRVIEGRVRELSLAATVKDLQATLKPFEWRLPVEEKITTDIDDIPDWVRDDG